MFNDHFLSSPLTPWVISSYVHVLYIPWLLASYKPFFGWRGAEAKPLLGRSHATLVSCIPNGVAAYAFIPRPLSHPKRRVKRTYPRMPKV